MNPSDSVLLHYAIVMVEAGCKARHQGIEGCSTCRETTERLREIIDERKTP